MKIEVHLSALKANRGYQVAGRENFRIPIVALKLALFNCLFFQFLQELKYFWIL